MARHHKTCVPWFFIVLILSNHGIALAMRVRAHHKASSFMLRPDKQVVARNHNNYSHMSCQELKVAMDGVIADTAGEVKDSCAEACSFSDTETDRVRSLATRTIQISAIADAADKNMCLPEVVELNEKLDIFLSAESRFVSSATSSQSQDRFRRAFAQLAVMQEEILSFHGHIFDRRLLFPATIEDPSVCPSPCLECTRAHNSWFGESEEDFAFKCILETGAPRPEGEGFDCAVPERRNSNWNQDKTWCQVHHWQDVAVQTIAISAKVGCGAKAVLAPLQHGNDFSDSLRNACERKESGEALPEYELRDLIQFDREVDEVVTPGNMAMFSVFLAIHLVSSVAELRRRVREPSSLVETRGPSEDDDQIDVSEESSTDLEAGSESSNDAASDVIEITGSHRDDNASYDASNATMNTTSPDPGYTYRQGSWSCRRSIASLANGLFGAMIEIMIGFAYFAIMGTFGLIAAMAMYTPEAMIAALAPHLGIQSFTISSAVMSTSQSVVESVSRMISSNALAIEAASSAGLAGAEAAASASGVAISGSTAAAASAAGTQALEAAVAAQSAEIMAGIASALASTTEALTFFWPAIYGGSLVFGVMFGIWGCLRIFNSFNNPFDCPSGYVVQDGQDACHPAMKFSETHTTHCPGDSEDAIADRLAFMCREQNMGIATYMMGHCF